MITEKELAPNKWMVLATVAFGTFMATLDSSIVNIALPTIRRELNAGDNVEWIVLSYLLVTTSTLLMAPRCGTAHETIMLFIM